MRARAVTASTARAGAVTRGRGTRWTRPAATDATRWTRPGTWAARTGARARDEAWSADAVRSRVERGARARGVETMEAASETTRVERGARAARASALAIGAIVIATLATPESAIAGGKAVAAAAGSDGSFWAKVLSWVVHLDTHLAELFVSQGKAAYGILFAIIFAETGFVVTPFLPGDSLLFACGALGSLGVINFPLAAALLFVAAVLGDTVNYSIGSFVGANFMETHPKIFPPEYITKTRSFYDNYGGKTVVLARFFVIVRTFAPFIAGVARMDYSKFITYNVLGGALWIASFMGLGYFFGTIPAVQENFALCVAGIVVLSLIPAIIEVVQHAKGGSTAPAN